MAHSYANALIHYIFSTKNRADLISPELQPKLWMYFAGIGKNHGIPVIAAGGIANDAHVLIALPSDMTIAKAIQLLKTNSSKWIGEHGVKFGWQQGYGAFSVSASNRGAVVRYIETQPEHQRRCRLKRNSRLC